MQSPVMITDSTASPIFGGLTVSMLGSVSLMASAAKPACAAPASMNTNNEKKETLPYSWKDSMILCNVDEPGNLTLEKIRNRHTKQDCSTHSPSCEVLLSLVTGMPQAYRHATM